MKKYMTPKQEKRAIAKLLLIIVGYLVLGLFLPSCANKLPDANEHALHTISAVKDYNYGILADQYDAFLQCFNAKRLTDERLCECAIKHLPYWEADEWCGEILTEITMIDDRDYKGDCFEIWNGDRMIGKLCPETDEGYEYKYERL